MSQQSRVVFSGVQPTSDSLHLGNALGAVSSGPVCRTTTRPTSASSTCTRSPFRRILTCCGGAPWSPPRSTWRWASTRPFDHLRAEPCARAHRTVLGARLFHRVRPGRPDDAVQGQVGRTGCGLRHGGAVHLPGSAGRRRAAVRHQPGPGRGGPASAPGTGPRYRPAHQRPFSRHVRGSGGDDRQADRQDLRPGRARPRR